MATTSASLPSIAPLGAALGANVTCSRSLDCNQGGHRIAIRRPLGGNRTCSRTPGLSQLHSHRTVAPSGTSTSMALDAALASRASVEYL